jgi:hypothetical protein
MKTATAHTEQQPFLLALPEGFEPTTFGSEDQRSIR